MDRDLSPDEQILHATREALRDEVARRKASEEELHVLHKAVAYYVHNAKTYNKMMTKAELRAQSYLRKIGVIE